MSLRTIWFGVDATGWQIGVIAFVAIITIGVLVGGVLWPWLDRRADRKDEEAE